jgi:hypothetical protein
MGLVEIKKKQDSSLKLILAAFLVFALLLCIAVIVLSVLLAKESSSNLNNHLCTTKSCIKYANMIMQNMDESVDPCDNFYEFSCGSFAKNVRIPDDQSKIDEFFILRDKVAYTIAGKFLTCNFI